MYRRLFTDPRLRPLPTFLLLLFYFLHKIRAKNSAYFIKVCVLRVDTTHQQKNNCFYSFILHLCLGKLLGDFLIKNKNAIKTSSFLENGSVSECLCTDLRMCETSRAPEPEATQQH